MNYPETVSLISETFVITGHYLFVIMQFVLNHFVKTEMNDYASIKDAQTIFCARYVFII